MDSERLNSGRQAPTSENLSIAVRKILLRHKRYAPPPLVALPSDITASPQTLVTADSKIKDGRNKKNEKTFKFIEDSCRKENIANSKPVEENFTREILPDGDDFAKEKYFVEKNHRLDENVANEITETKEIQPFEEQLRREVYGCGASDDGLETSPLYHPISTFSLASPNSSPQTVLDQKLDLAVSEITMTTILNPLSATMELPLGPLRSDFDLSFCEQLIRESIRPDPIGSSCEEVRPTPVGCDSLRSESPIRFFETKPFRKFDEFDDNVLEVDEELSNLRCSSMSTEVVSEKARRKNRCSDYPGFAFGLSMFSSDTMMKFNLIKNELNNGIKTELKRAEAEVAALNRRIQLIEEDLERSEERLLTATTKLAEASHAADESERIRKTLENRTNMEDDRIAILEAQLTQAKLIAEEADKKYEEVARKMVMLEADLERAEERAEQGEAKIVELEEELRVVGNNLKSLEVSEEKATAREESYETQIKSVTARLKDAEARAEFSERSVQKLQKEVDRLEDELVSEKEKYKNICGELDATFCEMSAY